MIHEKRGEGGSRVGENPIWTRHSLSQLTLQSSSAVSRGTSFQLITVLSDAGCTHCQFGWLTLIKVTQMSRFVSRPGRVSSTFSGRQPRSILSAQPRNKGPINESVPDESTFDYAKKAFSPCALVF